VRSCFGWVSRDDFENSLDEPSNELKGGFFDDGFENYQDDKLNELKKNKSRMLSEGRA